MTSRKDRRVLTLRPGPPVDVALTLQRYHQWGVDPANVCHAGAFYRVARAETALVPYRLTWTPDPDRPVLRVAFQGEDTAATRRALRREVGRLLGLAFDLPGFYVHAARDRVLGPLVRPLYGLRPSLTPDLLELLVGAISAQQVNLTFALATRARLVRHLGVPFQVDGVTVHAFPSTDALAAAEVPTLRAMQFSTRKAEFIVGLAQAVRDDGLDLAGLAAASDEAVVTRLTAIRGLGRWTAEWFLARGLGRPDVCPAEDLGVRRAMEALCAGGRSLDPTGLRRRARAWRPYRTLAVHYLLAGRRIAPSGGWPAAVARSA